MGSEQGRGRESDSGSSHIGEVPGEAMMLMVH